MPALPGLQATRRIGVTRGDSIGVLCLVVRLGCWFAAVERSVCRGAAVVKDDHRRFTGTVNKK